MVVLAKLYIDLIAIIPIVEYNILIMEVSDYGVFNSDRTFKGMEYFY